MKKDYVYIITDESHPKVGQIVIANFNSLFFPGMWYFWTSDNVQIRLDEHQVLEIGVL